jgi:hypothetical protein
VAVAANKDGQEPEQAEHERDHRAEIVTGSEPTDQSLGCRTGFWRGTGHGRAWPYSRNRVSGKPGAVQRAEA